MSARQGRHGSGGIEREDAVREVEWKEYVHSWKAAP